MQPEGQRFVQAWDGTHRIELPVDCVSHFAKATPHVFYELVVKHRKSMDLNYLPCSLKQTSPSIQTLFDVI